MIVNSAARNQEQPLLEGTLGWIVTKRWHLPRNGNDRFLHHILRCVL
jgi:hypothetical protein